MDEIWKPIAGYEGLYWVSNLGRIRSRQSRWNGRVFCMPYNRILKTDGCKGAYLQVSLKKNGTNLNTRVHPLVWSAFMGEVPQGMEINHKDGDKSNSRLDNLELMTRKQNVRHAIGLGMFPLGERN